MQVAQSTNAELLRALITHPDIYPGASDDGTPAPADLVVTVGAQQYWLIAYVEQAAAAVFFFHPSTSTTFEFHCGVLRPYRGLVGYAAGHLAVAWMRDHSVARKLICWVETDARHVYAYVRALGFGPEGLSHGSIQRQGTLKDRYLMGQNLCR